MAYVQMIEEWKSNSTLFTHLFVEKHQERYKNTQDHQEYTAPHSHTLPPNRMPIPSHTPLHRPNTFIIQVFLFASHHLNKLHFAPLSSPLSLLLSFVSFVSFVSRSSNNAVHRPTSPTIVPPSPAPTPRPSPESTPFQETKTSALRVGCRGPDSSDFADHSRVSV